MRFGHSSECALSHPFRHGSTGSPLVEAKVCMYYVYILKCDQISFYVGLTLDLERRLSQHKHKMSFHTKRYKSIQLVYSEKISDKLSAEKREKQIKGWSRAKKVALINGNVELLGKLSQSGSDELE